MSEYAVGYLREFDPTTGDWRIFKARLENYFLANEIVLPEKKRAILLNTLSENAYKLIYNLALPDKPEVKSYTQLTEIMDVHFKPAISIFAARYKFFNAVMYNSETANDWAARVRNLAAHCEFSATEIDNQMRDRFMVGYQRGSIQDRLFEEKKTVTFREVIEIAGAKAAAKNNRNVQEEIQVKSEPGLLHVRAGTSASRSTTQQHQHQQQRRGGEVCSVCGKGNHVKEKCFFKNSVCHVCGKRNHIASMCRNKNKIKCQNQINKSTHNFLETENSNNMQLFQLNESDNPLTVEIFITNIPIVFQIDTGASISAVSELLWKQKLHKFKLIPTTKSLISYNGNKIVPIGKITVDVNYKNVSQQLNLYVIKNGGPPIVGRDFLKLFKLGISELNYTKANNLCQTIDELKSKFKDVFSPGLGCFKLGLVSLKLNAPNITPKFCRARPLPYALKLKVENELERLQKLGIISPVNYSPWATPIVPVLKKDGTVRICGDFKVTVNPFIEIDQYPLPRIEDIFGNLQGGQLFSKLDLSQAYQQICLDHKSQELMTISTHKGLYRYTRLTYGVACAPAKFQKIMESVLQGIDNVGVFLDDVLVTGKDECEHIKTLEKVLSKLNSAGFKISIDKCKFFEPKVTYLGHEIDKDGLSTSDNKIEAIKKAPIPKNVTQLKSFLGLINFYSKFVPNISSILYPLYNLLKNDVTWEWSSKCQNAFNKIKQIMITSPVLVHFNTELPIIVTADASSYGLGAVIMHKMLDGSERPIAYASRTLTDTESKYSQIEKEALAIIFALNKFNQYLYGTKFVLRTDHRPLVAIYHPKKGIPQFSANRLRRWALILSNYRYDIEYVKSELNTADSLSRLPLSNTDNIENDNVDFINYFSANSEFPINFYTVQNAMTEDKTLSQILKYVQGSWPQNLDVEITDDVKPYYKLRNEISIQDNCLLWNNRLIIPEILREKLLNELHSTHMGINKMISLARSYFWWPKLDTDIANVAKTCESCLVHKKSPPKVPLHPWKWPTEPWNRIHIDYLGPFRNKYFLIILDAHSKWIEVFPVTSISSECTIEALRSTFARYGLPYMLVSDNAPQFMSESFQTFLKWNNIEHLTSPPFHPASNGAAENSVKTVKNALKNALADKRNVNLNWIVNNFLFDYRNTKHCTTGVTPSFLMFNRTIRSRFHVLKNTNTNVNSNIHNNVKISQERQCNYYRGNRNVKFRKGERVTTKDYRKVNKVTWIKGIIEKQIGKCTYLVNVPEIGKIWKRHVNQINKYETYLDSLPNLPDSDMETITDTNMKQIQNVTPPSTSENLVPVAEPKPVEQIKIPSSVPEQRKKSKRIIKIPDRLRY